MVKGVSAMMNGRPALLIAISVCGFAFWLLSPIHFNEQASADIPRYGANSLFFIGGLLFGLGAGFNQGCSISTLTRLAGRDLRMLATILGWVIGWLMFANISLQLTFSYPQSSFATASITLLILVLCISTVLCFMIHPARKTLLTILLFGTFSALLTELNPHWSPSHFLQAITYSVAEHNLSRWPDFQEHLIIATLLIGMGLGVNKAFIGVSKRQFSYHCCAGILMGMGASLALGGNDTQILFALPVLSLGGFTACLGIIIGIMLALKLMTYRQARQRQKQQINN